MKRARPWDGDNVDVVSSGESSSSDIDGGMNDNTNHNPSSITSTFSMRTPSSEEEEKEEEQVAVGRRAEIYQEYMKQIPIPMNSGCLVPFDSWVGLGKSLKKVYGQPLHYLTNLLLKQWDQERIGGCDEEEELDIVIHPSKAEATVWLIEEVHRKTSSHHHLAQLWLLHPMYQAFIDSSA